jgi:hypothetical protein
MIDANEWVLRLTAFDMAKAELLDLAEKAHEISERLTTNWQELHPPGRLQTNHTPGCATFSVDEWPSGQQLNEALGNCHQTYLALKEGFLELDPDAKKALKLDGPPAP